MKQLKNNRYRKEDNTTEQQQWGIRMKQDTLDIVQNTQ
jgi:hypothetical protein